MPGSMQSVDERAGLSCTRTVCQHIEHIQLYRGMTVAYLIDVKGGQYVYRYFRI